MARVARKEVDLRETILDAAEACPYPTQHPDEPDEEQRDEADLDG
jgi:hypothetical protein